MEGTCLDTIFSIAIELVGSDCSVLGHTKR